MRMLSLSAAACAALALAACSVEPITFTLAGPPAEEDCAAPGDEDGDGAADCDDIDCAALPMCAPAAACRDGTVDSGEQCDDGNEVDGDGCDRNCTTTGCGNGVRTTGEWCDDGNTAETDGCRNDCKFSWAGRHAPVADATITTTAFGNDANTNLGARPDLRVYGSSFGTTSRVLMAFDLASIPPGAPIRSATLNIRMVSGVGSDFAVEVREVGGMPWAEFTVTWNLQPPFGQPRALLPHQGLTTWRFDITPMVLQWIAIPSSNRGLMLRVVPEVPTSESRSVVFWSREGMEPPYLEIELPLAP